jgi:hypothetical protein
MKTALLWGAREYYGGPLYNILHCTFFVRYKVSIKHDCQWLSDATHKGGRKANDLLRRKLDRILSVQKWRKLGKESKMAKSRT